MVEPLALASLSSALRGVPSVSLFHGEHRARRLRALLPQTIEEEQTFVGI